MKGLGLRMKKKRGEVWIYPNILEPKPNQVVLEPKLNQVVLKPKLNQAVLKPKPN